MEVGGGGEGVDGGTIIPNDYPKLEDLLPIIKGVVFIIHVYTHTYQGCIRTGDLNKSVDFLPVLKAVTCTAHAV